MLTPSLKVSAGPPAPGPQFLWDESQPRTLLIALPPAGAAFASAGAALEEIGVVRGVRLARLTRLTSGPLSVQIQFTAPITPNDPLNDDPLLRAVRLAVINPAQVQSVAAPLTVSAPAIISPRALIEVKATGLTAITSNALAAAGFPVTTTQAANWHLWRDGNEIAAQWDGNRLLFFAEPRFSRWAATDIYSLTADDTPGLRMASRSADPTGLPAGVAWQTETWETNALYTPQCYCNQSGAVPPGRDGDRWAWDDFKQSQGKVYGFTLPTVDTSQAAQLTVWFIGYTDTPAAPDHYVEVRVNGALVGTSDWNGKQAITATFPISAGILVSGANNVSITLPGTAVEGMWLDAFAIKYARGPMAFGNAALFSGEAGAHSYTIALTSTLNVRAYEVTDAAHPTALTGLTNNQLGDSSGPHRYLITDETGIQTPQSVRMAQATATPAGANYLIISAPEFAPAIQPLIDLRHAQGLTVTVETTRAIYDTFGDGRPDPAALRAYLTNAYQSWSPRPVYVLLVGDGTFDPKQYRASSAATFIPPYLAEVDPWMGETAADNRYVTVDGVDALPDMLIGRWPVNSLAEAQTVMSKTVQYETAPYPGGWNGNALFVADAAEQYNDFPAEQNALIGAYITAPFTASTAYLTPPLTQTFTATRQILLNQWNSGPGLIVYNGHASPRQWAVGPLGQPLFHANAVPALSNGPRLPVVLELTCFTGSFHDAGGNTLDETLLRATNGGAVAVWGATGFGVGTGHQQLAQGFLNQLYSATPGRVGDETLAGKLALAASGRAPDLLDTLTLLGDPALIVNLTIAPWAAEMYLPVVRR